MILCLHTYFKPTRLLTCEVRRLGNSAIMVKLFSGDRYLGAAMKLQDNELNICNAVVDDSGLHARIDMEVLARYCALPVGTEKSQMQYQPIGELTL